MLCERFLAKDPDHRFSTMADVEAALTAFAEIVRPPGRDSQPMPYAVPIEEPLPLVPATVVSLPDRPRRSPNTAWLVATIVASAAGAALLVADPQRTAGADPNLALVRGDADKLAAAIESATRAAQLRADGLAQTPMLRAAIETDVATVNDMFKNEFSLKLDPGDTFELLQKHDGELVTMLRRPPSAKLVVRADHQPRLRVVKPCGLEVGVSTAVTSQRGDETGAVALGTKIDLSLALAQLGSHVVGAELRGLDAPMVLVPARGSGSSTELALAKELGVVANLAMTLPATPAKAPIGAWIRAGCWALAGLLGLLYFVNLLRARRTG